MEFGISSNLRLGVLAPGSNFIPFLAGDMLAAFEFGLTEARLDAEVIIESAGYNADLKMLITAVQQLILARRVKCIIAPLNVSLIEKLAGCCESQAVPLIALNLTEDPVIEKAQNPFVFVNSFYLWQCAWMSGYLAAQRFGQRACLMAAIHDGGYGLAFAFQLGLEAAQGSLIRTFVTHRDSRTEDPSEYIAQAAAQNPDFIWAAYSGKEAVSFLSAYEASGLKSQIPLITISPMISRKTTEIGGNVADGIWRVTPERRDSDSDSLTALTEVIGREPNPYALLAYEAAHLISEAVCRTSEARNFASTLRESKFDGPRGLTGFDDYKGTDLSFCLRQLSDSGDIIVETLDAPPLMNEQYLLACRKLEKQGWVNPYLCA